jgi:hypothetical protein
MSSYLFKRWGTLFVKMANDLFYDVGKFLAYEGRGCQVIISKGETE